MCKVASGLLGRALLQATVFTAIVTVLVSLGCAQQQPTRGRPPGDATLLPLQKGHAISGRVVDPLGVEPDEAILMVGAKRGETTFGSQPVAVKADGSFVTHPLPPATYLLQIVRTPHSRTKPATILGFEVVRVSTTDVKGVTVTIRRDMALTGAFLMESDNAAPVWPPDMSVMTLLVLDGMAMAD